jgi:hypothetical protein
MKLKIEIVAPGNVGWTVAVGESVILYRDQYMLSASILLADFRFYVTYIYPGGP